MSAPRDRMEEDQRRWEMGQGTEHGVVYGPPDPRSMAERLVTGRRPAADPAACELAVMVASEVIARLQATPLPSTGTELDSFRGQVQTQRVLAIVDAATRAREESSILSEPELEAMERTVTRAWKWLEAQVPKVE
jgi:hypothetical protein